jgi:hypothetical protein
MAGGKETPRQKMIGMMYLVLTALLALNVSKEIITAFVTLNNKLEDSRILVANNAGAAYDGFKAKEIALKTTKADMTTLNFWKARANILQKESAKLIGEILGHANTMIGMSEGGKDWVAENGKDADGNIMQLKPLAELSKMDDYDTPTNYFIGPDINSPKGKGPELIQGLHTYRDKITEEMGTYESNGKKWTFKAPKDAAGLKDALKSANPDDTAKIRQVYDLLTQPEKRSTTYGGKTKELPYVSVLFYHTPIVAATAMLTAMTVDVRNAEATVAEYYLSKVEAPSFNFNKIEPMAFARTGYLNQGDTMSLRVMIAAYDSTETPRIVFNGTEYNGPIPIKASGNPGIQKMSGVIYVKERGQEVPKTWTYEYSVGKPTGAVSLPEMFVLYRGYRNVVVGAASGYADYKLVGTNNVTLTKQGAEYIASPGQGREATISIQGVSPDGKSANLGSFQFRVRNMPKASVYLGSCEDGGSYPAATIKAQTRLFAKYGDDIPLTANFNISSYEVNVTGAPRPESGSGPALSPGALGLIRQARAGNTITIMTTYVGPDGKSRKSGASFKVQ